MQLQHWLSLHATIHKSNSQIELAKLGANEKDFTDLIWIAKQADDELFGEEFNVSLCRFPCNSPMESNHNIWWTCWRKQEEMSWNRASSSSLNSFFISLLSTVVVVFTAPFPRRSTVRPRQSTSFSQAISYASRARAEQVRRASSLQPWPASTPKRVVGTPKKKSGVDGDYSLLLLL